MRAFDTLATVYAVFEKAGANLDVDNPESDISHADVGAAMGRDVRREEAAAAVTALRNKFTVPQEMWETARSKVCRPTVTNVGYTFILIR